jgi:hypothetical protein
MEMEPCTSGRLALSRARRQPLAGVLMSVSIAMRKEYHFDYSKSSQVMSDPGRRPEDSDGNEILVGKRLPGFW